MTRLRQRPGGTATSLVTAVLVGAVLSGTLVGCGIAARTVTVATPAASPTPGLSGAVAITRVQVESALRGRNLAAIVPQVAYRPGESPALAAANRLVIQVPLPGDLDHGFIVIYDFPDAGTAYAAGLEMARYLSSGPGRVQFPPDARHVLRQVGSTLVFFTWSPADSPDPHTPDIAGALETLGTGIPIRL